MHARSWTPLSILLAATLPACGASPVEGSATDTEAGSSSGSETTASASATDTGPGGVCVPGMSVGCACPDGGAGAQVCRADGGGYNPCECAEATTDAPTTDAPTTSVMTSDVSATTDGSTTAEASTTADTTTGDTSGEPGTSTGVNGACAEVVTFELKPSEATLSGAWVLGMSMLGEGEITNIPNPQGGTQGAILYKPEIPCDDTWYIWARIFDQGNSDSYLATLDGLPEPAAIFEGDCTQMGNSYKWARLNWREMGANTCDYVEDPWAPTWAAGTHEIEFRYRESTAMGRILITNDPDLVPAP